IGTLIISALGIALLLSGCVTDNSPGSDSPDEAAAPEAETEDAPDGGDPTGDALAASSTTSTVHGADLRIEIHALDRVDEYRVRLDFAAVNDGGSDIRFYQALSDGVPTVANHVTLLDGDNGAKHLPWTFADGTCVC